MTSQHLKSPCCRTHTIRFGGRRRQCTRCKRTWRVRPQRRGQKARRCGQTLLRRTIVVRWSLRSQTKHSQYSYDILRYRFRRSLHQCTHQPRTYTLPQRGRLILLVDGVWFHFDGKEWVLYLMALRPVSTRTAEFLDPVLLPGKESSRQWRRVLRTIPCVMKQRICALVSDGFLGSTDIASARGWVFQRCHFHLLLQLQIRLGRRKNIFVGREIREEIYQSIREALETHQKNIPQLFRQLKHCAESPECPQRIRMMVRSFQRDIVHFRAYRQHPALHLPITTNSVESMVNIIRQSLPPLRTPESLQRWATALIRLRSHITCNGHCYQPN